MPSMERMTDARDYEQQLDRLVDVDNLSYDDAFRRLGEPPEGFYRSEQSQNREEAYSRGLTLARAILAMRHNSIQNT